MPLQTSGAISIANLQTEFGGASPAGLNAYYAGGANVPSGTSGTNGAVPASGIIGLWSFYGTAKAVNPTVGVYYSESRVTRLDANGALLGTNTSVGTYRYKMGGAKCGANAGFYGGEDTDADGIAFYLNTFTQITTAGALATTQTTVGLVRGYLAGAQCETASLYYGGTNNTSLRLATATRISTTGALIGSETTVGTSRYGLAGAPVNGNGLFHGGTTTGNSNTVTIINSNGALVQAETTVGTARAAHAGASVGGNGMFYGGWTSSRVNTCTRIGATGSIVGSETAVGTARYELAGASIGANGIYQGGLTTVYAATRTMISSTGALVGTEAAVGTTQAFHTGTGI